MASEYSKMCVAVKEKDNEINQSWKEWHRIQKQFAPFMRKDSGLLRDVPKELLRQRNQNYESREILRKELKKLEQTKLNEGLRLWGEAIDKERELDKQRTKFQKFLRSWTHPTDEQNEDFQIQFGIISLITSPLWLYALGEFVKSLHLGAR